MGSNSWHDDIRQALVVGLIVQIVAYMLGVFCASIWASLKERMPRSATGETMDESDVEMGPMNAGEGTTIRGTNNPHGLAVNLGVGDDGQLENTEDMADTRASTPEARIPTPEALCDNVTEDMNRRAPLSVVVDGSPNQQVEVVAAKGSLNLQIPVAAHRLPNAKYS